MALTPVRLKGTYFSTPERRFLPVGAHWVPARAALQWPLQWDEADIEADFAKMHELGFNTVRFDLFWAWFEPRPGDYNPEAFTQLDFLIRLAHQYEIYLHPTFFIGGEVGEAWWDVPWRHGRHPHSDPEMLRLQTDHVTEFARRYQGENAILAWDLTDEPPYWIVSGQTSDAMAINWTRLLAGRRLLVTGATGFLGKVALSMLLHRYPGVGRVFVLVRPGTGGNAVDRFFGKVAPSRPFDPLRAVHGEGFEAFLRQKVVPLAGDVASAPDASGTRASGVVPGRA